MLLLGHNVSISGCLVWVSRTLSQWKTTRYSRDKAAKSEANREIYLQNWRKERVVFCSKAIRSIISYVKYGLV